ncbi:MAG: response regulator transcription factor [Arcobacteraceae bacterium]|jgi:DNA-binding response OmpR family regulator|nr:response regulator transcription factor [Arcobacteraceae bacterium]
MNGDLLVLKNKTVLFAEDDKIMKEQITEVLEMLFKKVFLAEDGEKAYELYLRSTPDIIISDIKMPNMNGLQLIEKIRQSDYETPVVLLTSFTEQDMLVHAVNLSIDGYIIKPLELKALISTINKAMKRMQKNQGLIPLTHNIFYNSGTQELYHNSVVIQLGGKELELIKLLITHRARTVSKEEISAELWPFESSCDSAIKSLILRIRKKIGGDIIISVRGVGYRLDTRNLSE